MNIETPSLDITPTAEQQEEQQEVQGLDAPVVVREITLKAKDGESLIVRSDYCSLSTFLHTLVESDQETNEIPLDIIKDKQMLQIIVDFLNLHKGKEPQKISEPLKSVNLKECTTVENANFIETLYAKGGNKLMYDILAVANFLSISSLLQLTCSKLASLIKAKPVESIRTILAP